MAKACLAIASICPPLKRKRWGQRGAMAKGRKGEGGWEREKGRGTGSVEREVRRGESHAINGVSALVVGGFDFAE